MSLPVLRSFPLRIDALSIGPAETTRTDPKPEVRSALSTMSANLRAAMVAAACIMPGYLSAADTTEPVVAAPVSREQQLEETEKQLHQICKEVSEHLYQKSCDLSAEYNALCTRLKTAGYSENLRQLTEQWDRLVTQYFDHEDGRDALSAEGQMVCYEEIESMLERHASVFPEVREAPANAAFVCANAQRLHLEEQYRTLLMTDENGKRLRLFPDEWKDNPALTTEVYLDKLAKQLKTPHNLAMFLRVFFRYTIDTDDEAQPLKKGSRLTQKEYWQMPEETVRRVENNRMLGDCDDITVLCCDQLARMGKTPAAVYIHGVGISHYTCVWAHKIGDEYVVSDMGTDGLWEGGRLRVPFEIGWEDKLALQLSQAMSHPNFDTALKAGLRHFLDNPSYSLSDIDDGNIRIQFPPADWSTQASPLDRVKMISLKEFAETLFPVLTPMEPMMTAGTDVPPPPPE